MRRMSWRLNEAYFLVSKKWGIQKDLCAQEPHRVLLGWSCLVCLAPKRSLFIIFLYFILLYSGNFWKAPSYWRMEVGCQGDQHWTLVVVESLSNIQLLETPWTAARQASLSFTISQNLFKLMSIESVMPPNHLILCCPLLLLPSIFPSIRVFPMSQLITSGGQSIGASASVLTMNIQGWFPFRLTDLISLVS